MAQDLDEPHRDYGLYVGKVVSVDDPEKRGFVDVSIAGHGKKVRAQCVMPGSPFANGIFVVPVVGAEVIIGYLNGEYSSPIVLGGLAPPVVAGGMRAAMKTTEVPRVITVETDDFVVIIGAKDTPAPYISIVSRKDEEFSLILDLNTKIAALVMPNAIDVRTKGLINLEAPLTQLNKRTVQANSEPI